MDLYAQPQQLVPITRRRRLNVLLTGEGPVTVILSAGGGGSTIHWGLVQAMLPEAIRGGCRVLSFDRAGMGFSDAGPMPRTAGSTVDDLRAAMSALSLAPPYVVVGHSMGSFDARLHAYRFPEEVVGAVLVDPRGDGMTERLSAAAPEFMAQYRRDLQQFRRNAAMAARRPAPGSDDYAALDVPDDPQLTPAVNAAFRAERLRASFWRTTVSEGVHLDTTSAAELAAAKRPLDIPLIVLTAGRPPLLAGATPDEAALLADDWTASHVELARLSSRGERRDVPDVGHMIPTERPDAVVEAIRDVIEAAR